MVLREDNEVDKKVSEKKHDKKESPKTSETNCEIKSASPPPSNVSDPVGTYKPRVPYP